MNGEKNIPTGIKRRSSVQSFMRAEKEKIDFVQKINYYFVFKRNFTLFS
jgi:hypothetical protein